MGDVVPFRSPGACRSLGQLAPQLPTLPSAELVLKLSEVGVRFHDGARQLLGSYTGTFISPVELAVTSRKKLVGKSGFIPQESFFRASRRLQLAEMTPRVVLEILLQPRYLPDGDYYVGWSSNRSRIHISKRTVDHMLVRDEPSAALVNRDYDWLWCDTNPSRRRA